MSGHTQEVYTRAVSTSGNATLDLTNLLPGGYATGLLVVESTAGLDVTLMDGTSLALQNPALGIFLPIRCKTVQCDAGRVLAMQ